MPAVLFIAYVIQVKIYEEKCHNFHGQTITVKNVVMASQCYIAHFIKLLKFSKILLTIANLTNFKGIAHKTNL